MSLTQTGDEVTGYLTVATWNGKGGTKANTISLTGSTTGDSVALTDNSTGRVYTLQKTNGQLNFSYPTETGQIANRVLIPASSDQFNQVLSTWQKELSDEEQVALDIQAKSKTLGDYISYIESETNSMNNSVKSLEEILSDSIEASDIQGMQDALILEKDEAAVRPMTCYQVDNNVGIHYNTINYYYDRLTDERANFAKKASSLETSLDQVPAYITATNEVAQTLDQATQNAAYTYPGGPWPGDEKTPISEYQAAADAARSQLPQLKATDEANQKTADSLMAEGKSVLDKAKALVSCPP